MFLVNFLNNPLIQYAFYSVYLCYLYAFINQPRQSVTTALIQSESFNLLTISVLRGCSIVNLSSIASTYCEAIQPSSVQNTIIVFVIPAVSYGPFAHHSLHSKDLFRKGQIIFAVLWKKSIFRFILQL